MPQQKFIPFEKHLRSADSTKPNPEQGHKFNSNNTLESLISIDKF